MTAALVACLLVAPPGRVTVELCPTGTPAGDRWPDAAPVATSTHTVAAFGLARLPHDYTDSGVRAEFPPALVVRMSATVELPTGTHRLLLRGRGGSRLTIDGKQVLTTPFPPPTTDGHNPIPTDYLDLGPDFRFAPPGNREAWTRFTTPGGRHAVAVESVVGGTRGKSGARRPEPGELVVAVSLAGQGGFTLLGSAVPYTDAGWTAYAAAEERALLALEDDRRRAAFASQKPFWDRRRELARRWLSDTPEVPVPPTGNPVDHFVAAGIAAAKNEASAGGELFAAVRPVLEARCYSCHSGAKAKGDLRLDVGKPDAESLLARVTSTDDGERMPPQGERLTAGEVKALRDWLAAGAGRVPPVAPLTGPAEDLTFLRRASLDVIGVIPSPAEIDQYLADAPAERRTRLIDRLLADPRRADAWVGYWQDVLAENPNILNPTLNNTGPFRWWLWEAFRDAKPADVLVTELVRMKGGVYTGGPAGFGVASGNDVPTAEKAVTLAAAFQGVNMKCARCHDAPANKATQRELFQLAAMLAEKPLKVPATSSVPADKLHAGDRKPLIAVTLAPGTTVPPAFPLGAEPPVGSLPEKPTARDKLAAALTVPQNERFARVLANRVWKRLMGRGIVEPADDWEKGTPTHPELLDYLARELVRSGYDLRAVERLILTSHAYGRAVNPALARPDPLYTASARRRLPAEAVVDSLFAAAGLAYPVEEFSLDIDGQREMKQSISLGRPTRAWMFGSTSNERDRPSLALPRAQAVVDLLEAFGWRATRPDPLTDRDTAPNAAQPAVLANGTAAVWLTRLTDAHAATTLGIEASSPEELADQLYTRVLTRPPTAVERAALADHLRPGFSGRHATPPPGEPPSRKPPKYVSWSSHLTPEATDIQIELTAAARRGDLATGRLDAVWRRRLEDAVWSLLNAPEFVFTP